MRANNRGDSRPPVTENDGRRRLWTETVHEVACAGVTRFSRVEEPVPAGHSGQYHQIARLGGLPNDSNESPDSRSTVWRSSTLKSWPSPLAAATNASMDLIASYRLLSPSSAPPAIRNVSTFFFDIVSPRGCGLAGLLAPNACFALARASTVPSGCLVTDVFGAAPRQGSTAIRAVPGNTAVPLALLNGLIMLVAARPLTTILSLADIFAESATWMTEKLSQTALSFAIASSIL